jgi:Peptidase C10 family.
LLNKYKYQIDGLKAGTMVPVKLPKYATTPVAPLVTANWDQSAPYNRQCPTSGGSHAVTGCPATSLAMCYYKWKWPDTYPAVAALSGTGGLSAPALPERAADWDNIIDEYTGPTNYSYTTEQADAVAWLMRYAGQAIPDYQYSTSASGANDPEIYQGCLNMGYTDAEYLLLTELVSSGWTYTNGPQQYTDDEWNEYMMTELHNGRPIEYLAYDVSYGFYVSGHAFNVFGCDANGKYYVNWGWSGDSNGYCTLHNFTTATGATGQSGAYVFNYGEAMIIGIEPPAGALTDPRIKVNPTTLTMNTILGNPVTATFTVTGYNLTEDVNLTLSGDDAFSLSANSINVTEVQNQGGVTVTVTYDPTTVGTNEAVIALASEGAGTVNVKLNGVADLEIYDPVMLEATNITSKSFTATWTDETPAENVESYTLYVSAEPFLPPVALLDTTDWTSNNNVPAGWTASSLNYYGSNNACYLSSSGYVQTKTYDLTGYDKMTVMIYSEPYNNNNTMTVATSVDSKTITLTNGSSFTWYTFVLDCASSDYIYLTTSGLPDMRYMKVYAGDLTATTQLKASETGDENYRVITGITGKSYNVTGLTENGTFYFYVMANYINGAVGNSNTQVVTLTQSGHGYEVGDVNHDNVVSIVDVTDLIDYLLGSGEICLECADMDGSGDVNISDVTDLIDYMLGAH